MDNQAKDSGVSSPIIGLEPYIGTKIVGAKPMTAVEFSQFKGKPDDHENMPGYLVCYEDGYQSWSPKDVFEKCYRKISDRERMLSNLR